MKQRENNNLTPLNSPEVQIITDSLEGGAFCEVSLMLINQCHIGNDLPIRGINQIADATHRLYFIVVVLRKYKQGSACHELPWTLARRG